MNYIIYYVFFQSTFISLYYLSMLLPRAGIAYSQPNLYFSKGPPQSVCNYATAFRLDDAGQCLQAGYVQQGASHDVPLTVACAGAVRTGVWTNVELTVKSTMVARLTSDGGAVTSTQLAAHHLHLAAAGVAIANSPGTGDTLAFRGFRLDGEEPTTGVNKKKISIFYINSFFIIVYIQFFS